MIDFATARRMMVDGQLRPNDVTDARILGAMLETPRERFLPQAKASWAYLDFDLPILEGPDGRPRRRMLKPMLLGKMIQIVSLRETDSVLDIGCGTGYSSAVIAQLARTVVALEEEAALALAAKESLYALGITNVSVETGPLAAGYPARAPYDVIFLQGATEVEPQMLFPQLRDGGRLVCVRDRGGPGTAVLYRRSGDDVSGWPSFDATASVLPGFAATPAFVF
ncbi:MAG TPA: protein-L-isoaspartate O-methyltransferase [Xanthobacteraceae bacterium]|nr:protein-L-isoaspartate O-methyltransferase [Xanthobacteraceae bacterium]